MCSYGEDKFVRFIPVCDFDSDGVGIVQGGPHNHTIGGLAVCLKYAQSPEFKIYQNQVYHLYLFIIG